MLFYFLLDGQLHYIFLLSVDYVHSDTSVTPLMVAAGRGHLQAVEQLLQLGAALDSRAVNDWNALEWAKQMGQPLVVELLEGQQ